MIRVRLNNERGNIDHGWLNTYHSFSFGEYYDPNHHEFSVLRVLNEDFLEAGEGGFPMHPHRNMEIITYIAQGALRHQDSLGNIQIIRQGEVQYMCAGKGIVHSEHNASSDYKTQLFQIWIRPNQNNLTPHYVTNFVTGEKKQNQWCLIASGTGENDSIQIHQDIKLWNSVLNVNEQLNYVFPAERWGYIHLVRGRLTVNEVELRTGDGAYIQDEKQLTFLSLQESEVLFFDLPPEQIK